jgi:hypothetical protein
MSAAAIPYLLLGEARTAALRERLLHGVQAWQQHWFAHAATLDLAVHPAVDPPWPGPLRTVFGVAGQPLLQVEVTTEFVARALCLQAMSAPGGSSGMAAQLAPALQLDMLQHLAESLLALSGVRASPLPDADDDIAVPIDSRRWWHATLAQPHSFERLLLLIHPTLVAGLVRVPRAPTSAALVSRHAAIGGEVVSVEAWLGEVRLTLRDFTTLRAGDVLVLEDDQCAQLAALDGVRIATLQPGHQHLQRAVRIDTVLQRLDSHSHPQNSRGS